MGLESPIFGNDENKAGDEKQPGSIKRGLQKFARSAMLAGALSGGVGVASQAEAKNVDSSVEASESQSASPEIIAAKSEGEFYLKLANQNRSDYEGIDKIDEQKRIDLAVDILSHATHTLNDLADGTREFDNPVFHIENHVLNAEEATKLLEGLKKDQTLYREINERFGSSYPGGSLYPKENKIMHPVSAYDKAISAVEAYLAK